MSNFTILLIIIAIGFSIHLPAEATLCRTIDNHNICILKIKRSAKYYWEYRTAISIDGKKRPIEIYNCRTHSIIQADRSIVSFQERGIGDFICSRFTATK